MLIGSFFVSFNKYKLYNNAKFHFKHKFSALIKRMTVEGVDKNSTFSSFNIISKVFLTFIMLVQFYSQRPVYVDTEQRIGHVNTN